MDARCSKSGSVRGVLLLLMLSGCGKEAAPRAPASVQAVVPAHSAATNAVGQSTPKAPEQSRPPEPVENQREQADQTSAADAAESPQKIYRASDVRPIRDDERAAELGVLKYTSERLILYTDIDPEIARTLPPVIDQAYAAWVEYFGELPPNREGTPYQVTGYLIDDPSRFVAAGMLPEGPPMFRFGRHIGAEFWMNKMNSDYYRRHLLIHEATHCFMTTMPQQYPPRWYLEGMAEFFGTHHVLPDGRVQFGVMPQVSSNFPGLGRIELIQQELAQNRFASLAQLGAYTAAQWDRPVPIPYAWSWAVCEFLDRHPRYRERFRQLGQHMEGSAFQRYMAEHFEPDRALLCAEWEQFAHRLEYEYDVPANAFVAFSGDIQPVQSRKMVTVDSGRGWQSTGLKIGPGDRIEITAGGDVVLDQSPKPWRSEPQGISIHYAAGHPIGMLLAAVLVDTASLDQGAPVFQVFPVGRSETVMSQTGGEVWLRVNDFGNGLANNSGSYQVDISPASTSVKSGE